MCYFETSSATRTQWLFAEKENGEWCADYSYDGYADTKQQENIDYRKYWRKWIMIVHASMDLLLLTSGYYSWMAFINCMQLVWICLIYYLLACVIPCLCDMLLERNINIVAHSNDYILALYSIRQTLGESYVTNCFSMSYSNFIIIWSFLLLTTVKS